MLSTLVFVLVAFGAWVTSTTTTLIPPTDTDFPIDTNFTTTTTTAPVNATECWQVFTELTAWTGNSASGDVIMCPDDINILSVSYSTEYVTLENRGDRIHVLAAAREDFPDSYNLGIVWTDTQGQEGRAVLTLFFMKDGATRPAFVLEADPFDIDSWDTADEISYAFALRDVERPNSTFLASDFLRVHASNGSSLTFHGITPLERYMEPSIGTERTLTVNSSLIAQAVGLEDVTSVSLCVIIQDDYWTEFCDYTENDHHFRFAAEKADGGYTNGCTCVNFGIEGAHIDPVTHHLSTWLLVLIIVTGVIFIGGAVYFVLKKPIGMTGDSRLVAATKDMHNYQPLSKQEVGLN